MQSSALAGALRPRLLAQLPRSATVARFISPTTTAAAPRAFTWSPRRSNATDHGGPGEKEEGWSWGWTPPANQKLAGQRALEEAETERAVAEEAPEELHHVEAEHSSTDGEPADRIFDRRTQQRLGERERWHRRAQSGENDHKRRTAQPKATWGFDAPATGSVEGRDSELSKAIR